MVTEVIMKREIFGSEISQKSKSGFLSATDLERVGNKYRVMNELPFVKLHNYFVNSKNKEFMDELSKKYGNVKTDGRGKGNHIWVHPLLFLDIALWLDPKLKIQVYEWLQDHLLEYRNDSGDSYKMMSGALFMYAKNKALFHTNMPKVARLIRLECDVKDWESATESQLKLRNKMHEYISFACDIVKDPNMAIEIGIMKAKGAKNV